jgi:hypothetical protein
MPRVNDGPDHAANQQQGRDVYKPPKSDIEFFDQGFSVREISLLWQR